MRHLAPALVLALGFSGCSLFVEEATFDESPAGDASEVDASALDAATADAHLDVVDGGGNAPDASAPNPDASASIDGAIASEDAATPSDGAVLPPDAAIAPTDGAVVSPDATVAPTDAATVPPDATVIPPDATVISPDAAISPPDAAILLPDAAVARPDAAVASYDAGPSCPSSSTLCGSVCCDKATTYCHAQTLTCQPQGSGCDPVTQGGCEASQACYLDRDSGEKLCLTPPSTGGAEGASCVAANDCAQGLGCWAGNDPYACAPFCAPGDDTACTSLQLCADLGDGTVGVCLASPAVACGTLTLPEVNTLSVQCGGTAIDFSSASLFAAYDPYSDVHSFWLDSADGEWSLEMDYTSAQTTCPESFPLPIAETATADLYLIDNLLGVTYDAWFGTGGTFTVDSFHTGPPRSTSFRCAACVLTSGDASEPTTCTVAGAFRGEATP